MYFDFKVHINLFFCSNYINIWKYVLINVIINKYYIMKGLVTIMANTPKLYPLTAAQRLHFFTLKYCPKKQVLNIGISLTILDNIDFEMLKKAIYIAYDRCEAMRLRFTEGKDGQTYQYIVPKEERDIETFDFTGWKFEDAESKLRQWTEEAFERHDSPMNKIVMITMPDGYKGIYMKVDHMTMDSHSIIVFTKDIIEIYCNLKYDTPFPKDLTSYEKALQKDLEYENDSKALASDTKYWHKYLEEAEPMFTDINGTGLIDEQRKKEKNPNLRAASIVTGNVDANITTFHLEEEPSTRLIDFCAENRIPFVCLLMMGLRTYLSKQNNNEPDVSIKTTVARRATLLEKKSGGTRIHFFPCRSIVHPEDTFLEGIEKIQESQNNIFRHANYDSIKLLNERGQYYNTQCKGYECMSLTYQPLTMKKNAADIGDIKYKCEWYSNGAAASPLYLTVMHRSLDNGLDFYFEYQTGVVTDKELNDLYYYLCRIIFKGVENPNMTVGEILDWA